MACIESSTPSCDTREGRKGEKVSRVRVAGGRRVRLRQPAGTYEARRVGREGLRSRENAHTQLNCQPLPRLTREAVALLLTLAIAGANPLNNALGPSALTVLTAQSIKPLYVPSGDPCRRDLITSGGIANVHIVTPARPPASVTAERLSAPGSWPAGVRRFLTYSYATKYLD